MKSYWSRCAPKFSFEPPLTEYGFSTWDVMNNWWKLKSKMLSLKTIPSTCSVTWLVFTCRRVHKGEACRYHRSNCRVFFNVCPDKSLTDGSEEPPVTQLTCIWNVASSRVWSCSRVWWGEQRVRWSLLGPLRTQLTKVLSVSHLMIKSTFAPSLNGRPCFHSHSPSSLWGWEAESVFFVGGWKQGLVGFWSNAPNECSWRWSVPILLTAIHASWIFF